MNRRISIRKEARERFLEELTRHGNVSRAAEAIGRSRWTLYRYRADHPDFAELWDQANEQFIDALETEAAKRATVGVQRPIYQGGKQVGTVTELSDSLLIFLLDRKRYPQKSKHELTGKDGQAINVREVRDTIVDPAANAKGS